MNQDRNNKESKIEAQQINMPKGGGAISSLGESFQPNAFSGTGSFSVPLPTTAGRGLEPGLSLSYNSGSGNGLFGLGFSLNLSKISIKTSQGLPQYNDQDVYLLDGSELVVKQNGNSTEGDYAVTEYLPRIVGSFITIKRYRLLINDQNQVPMYWRVIDNAGSVQIYGQSTAAQVKSATNPQHPSETNPRIFEWLIESITDIKGNKITYEYKQEDASGAATYIFEQDTAGAVRADSNTQQYIKKVSWGNYTINAQEQYAYQLVFDYGEHQINPAGGVDPYLETGTWNYRPDAFSTYTGRFEIRTRRRCENVLLFHNFPDELGAISLVKVLSVDYQQTQHSNLSTAKAIKVSGYRRSGQLATDSYATLAMPQIDLSFSRFVTPESSDFQELTATNNTIPGYLNNGGFLPIDLNREGIAGLLYQTDNGLMYLEPEGDGKYAKPKNIEAFPVDRNLRNNNILLSDLEGRGHLELVVRDKMRKGFYPQVDTPSASEGNKPWGNYQAFPNYPTDYAEPYMESADLSNNGKTDMFFFNTTYNQTSGERRVFTAKYPSLGRDGFAKLQEVPNNTESEISLATDFPLIKRGYKQEYVGFNNIIGDGMPHRIKVSRDVNNQKLKIEYWPSLGYGYFGEKITLDTEQLISSDTNFIRDFDIARLFFADIDGSGTIDLIYAYANHADVYINQNGNSFASPISVDLPIHYSNIDQISFADILGNGTSCMVITKISPKVTHYYYNFIGKNAEDEKVIKPYLLNEINNNLGSITKLSYSSSTQFYLADKNNNHRPWITTLAFPVQVVEKVTHINLLTNSRFTTRYAYHDGYYDFVEREFRGFAFVEQWDSEEYAEFVKNSTTGEHDYQTLAEQYYVPPTYTKSWYHTGLALAGDTLQFFKDQYYAGDTNSYDMPNDYFDPQIEAAGGLTQEQAYTALQGKVIRSELYFADGSALADVPVTVSESNLKVQLYQELAVDDRYAVFMVLPRESISYHYERNNVDPRVEQSFVLASDQYGNELLSAHVFLARRNQSDPNITVYQEQLAAKATLGMSKYVTPLANDQYCHVGCEQKDIELVNFVQADLEVSVEQPYIDFGKLKLAIDALSLSNPSNIVPYGQAIAPSAGLAARLLSWQQSYFWNQGQTDYLPLQQITEQALLHHQEEAVFTNANLTEAFDGRLSTQILEDNGGYVWDSISGYWWSKGLTQYYLTGAATFFLPFKTANSFVDSSSSLYAESTAEYDDYYLHTVATSSYLNTSITIDTNVEIDYITGGVKRATDANNNVSEFLFDPLGQVIVTSHYGTQLDSNDNVINVGGMGLYNDSVPVDKYVPVASPTFDDILADPTKYLQGAGSFYYYNLYAWTTDNQPVSSISLVRQDYYTVKPVINESDCQIGIVYSDGFGQALEAKSKDEPGLSFIRLPDGSLKKDGNGNPVEEYSTERWRTSGRTVFNNKNLPVEQYLPYYINNPYYEDQADVPTPPPTKTYYDPLGRTIKAVTPKGFFSKVEFTPWETKHFDENDTVIDSDYVQNNYASLTGYAKTAIDKAILHYNTPSIAIADNRGASFLAITNNLGNVTTTLFEDNGIDATTATEIYNYLLSNGYLYTENKTYGTVNKTFSFLTGQFRPYNPSFGFINLPANLLPYNSDMISILKQNCITEYHELDIQGRNTVSTDPRLYYENLTANTEYYNFKYLYPMNAKSPFYSDSIDAGIEKHMSNIYGQNIFSWTARDYCQISEYDNLQRPIATYVKHIDSPGAITDYSDFDIVTLATYGENPNGMSETEAKNRNLYGQAYKLNDLSGITLSDSYDITAKAIEVSKQLVEAYQDQIKWNIPANVVLQSQIYTHAYQYNAINQLLAETTPDSSITNRIYDRGGSLISISVTYQGSTGDIRPIITNIEYDSNNQRSKVTYANGVITEYSYETTTLRLTNLVSTRTSDSSKVQDIDYYYDPVGNITNLFDRTADTVFYNNQQVSPITTYTYDALYRLLQSNGRVHPNLTKGNTEGDKDSFKNTQFISTTDNSQQLENYTENYTYDDAGNFIKKQHSATTNSWTTNTDVAANSNRLADLETNGLYDANGNALSLSIGSTTQLVYNWKNELQQATIIARDDAITDDTEYYVYDNGGMRTRRVTQKLVSSVITNIDDKLYLGNYEVKKKIAENQLDPGDDGQYFERHTLRIMDGDTCVAIIYDWVQDDRQQEVDSVPTVRVQYQLGNHLGSVSLELSDSAQLISYEEYFAYGGSAFMAGSSQKEVKVKEYRYSGKERDDTTGLYYYGARYYAPWLGRWITTDLAGRVDGMNVYGFVQGNPLSFKDQQGYVGKNFMQMEGFLLNGDKYIKHSKTLGDKNKPGAFGFKPDLIISVEDYPRHYNDAENKEEDLAAALNHRLFTKLYKDSKTIDHVRTLSSAFLKPRFKVYTKARRVAMKLTGHTRANDLKISFDRAGTKDVWKIAERIRKTFPKAVSIELTLECCFSGGTVEKNSFLEKEDPKVAQESYINAHINATDTQRDATIMGKMAAWLSQVGFVRGRVIAPIYMGTQQLGTTAIGETNAENEIEVDNFDHFTSTTFISEELAARRNKQIFENPSAKLTVEENMRTRYNNGIYIPRWAPPSLVRRLINSN